MKKGTNYILCVVCVAILLNLVLPPLVGIVVPANNASNGEVMQMIRQHGQTPVSSSIVVAIMVLVSLLVAQQVC